MTNLSIKVRSVAGIERADLEGEAVILVSGPNGAGKTSLLMASAAALTGVVMPYEELTRGQGGVIVRSGMDVGRVQVRLGEGTATIQWPDAALKTEGPPNKTSGMAAGLVDLFSMSERARAEAIAGFIKAEPTRADLEAALADAGIKAPARKEGEADADYAKRNIVDQVWTATEGGWDAAHSKAKDRGVVLKNDFKRLTGGETWGAQKGADWLPKHWVPELAGKSVEDMDAACQSAQEGVEAAVANAAVDKSEVERLEQAAAGANDLRTKLQEAVAAEEAARGKVRDAKTERDALPSAEPDTLLKCPHCDEPIKIEKRLDGLEIKKGGKNGPSEAELKKRRLARVEADGKVTKAERELEDAIRATLGLRAGVDTAVKAADRLKTLQGKSGSAQAVVDARAELQKNEEWREAVKQKLEAAKIHAALLRNQAIVRILAPEGLRKVTLAKALERFNDEQLAPLCDAAGWKRVELDDNLVPKYGGRAVPLSAGEKYRVRAALQVAVARIDGSQCVVLDGADILDTAGRNGLLKLLRAWGGPALVGMTFGKPEQAVDLAKLKPAMGVTYWIEGAVAMPLAERLAAKEAA